MYRTATVRGAHEITRFDIYKNASPQHPSLSISEATSQELTDYSFSNLTARTPALNNSLQPIMKLTFAVVLLSTVLLSVFGYPYPEPDYADTVMARRYPRQAQFQPRPQFSQPKIDLPKPQQQSVPRGNIGGNVDYSRGGGLTGTVTGDATLWQSRNGRSDLGANGHYTRTFTGPARGHHDYGAGVTFRHRF